MANNPIKVNPLGQIADGVVEELKGAGSGAAKAMASEPAKILEQILGGKPTTDALYGEGTVAQSDASINQEKSAQQENLLKIKQQNSQVETAAQYKLHQQRLQEEIRYHEESKQVEAQKIQAENRQEAKKQEIVQLQKEKQDEAVWQQQLKAVQGSHEGQQGKM